MVVKGLAAATVSAVVTSLVIFAFLEPPELWWGGLLVFAFGIFLYGIPIAGVAALTVGLPVHLLLSRYRVRSLMAYLIAGVIAPFVVGVWFALLIGSSWREVLRFAAFASPGGLVAAGMFWRVAVRPQLTSRQPIAK